MIKTLKCPKCQKEVEICLSEAGPHTKASCVVCGAYIKFISQAELEGNMSDVEIVVEIEGSEYNEIIIINKYQDTYSLVSGRKGKDGKPYMQWCFPQDKDKQPKEKALPWKVSLGKGKDAKKTVEAIARAFGIVPGSSKEYDYDKDPESRIPF